MKLATIRIDGDLIAARIDDVVGTAVCVDGGDVQALLARHDWRARAEGAHGRRLELQDVEYAPVVPTPGKIVCVGLNYRTHILEMGRELPSHPTLFAKFADALIGAHDDIQLPPDSEQVDWEAELAVVVGAQARSVSTERAAKVIAGYAVLNDVTIRDRQYRTTQWLQGKTFEGTTPLGPWLVTPDELPAALEVTCEVDGETMQKATTDDLVFDAPTLVSYVSGFVTLRPGDVIATGTPGGVGHARTPARYLGEGSVLTTTITGLGTAVNVGRRSAT